MTRLYPSKWFFIGLGTALLAWFAYSFFWHRSYHPKPVQHADVMTITVGGKAETVLHSVAIREAGRQLKEEISRLPDAPITNRTTEAQVLVVLGRTLKENAELKTEVARLKAGHGEVTAALAR